MNMKIQQTRLSDSGISTTIQIISPVSVDLKEAGILDWIQDGLKKVMVMANKKLLSGALKTFKSKLSTDDVLGKLTGIKETFDKEKVTMNGGQFSIEGNLDGKDWVAQASLKTSDQYAFDEAQPSAAIGVSVGGKKKQSDISLSGDPTADKFGLLLLDAASDLTKGLVGATASNAASRVVDQIIADRVVARIQK